MFPPQIEMSEKKAHLRTDCSDRGKGGGGGLLVHHPRDTGIAGMNSEDRHLPKFRYGCSLIIRHYCKSSFPYPFPLADLVV